MNDAERIDKFQEEIIKARDKYGFSGIVCIVSERGDDNDYFTSGIMMSGKLSVGEAAVMILAEALRNVDKDDREDAATLMSVLAINDVEESEEESENESESNTEEK